MSSHKSSYNQRRGRYKRPVLAIICTAVFLQAGLCRADQLPVAAIPGIVVPLLTTLTNPVDAEKRTTMPMTTSQPWGAVGFLDNGCTATLIDNQHILAASHCFTFDYDRTETNGAPYLQGAWQRGLVFFPNYHPSRPNPVRIPIDRVIVGSRVQSDPDTASDWGIAHLASVVSDFPALTMDPKPRWRYPSFVQFAGYARDDNVYPAKSASFPEPAPEGYCANFHNNCWWIPALVDQRCLAIDEENGFVRMDNFSCLVQGGNSGSPVVWNAGDSAAPSWRLTGLISGGGGFWNATCFQYAPRYAADVAVSSFDDGTKRSQVFAIDSDMSRVVSRYRVGTTTSGPLSYFRDLGKISGPRSISAIEQINGKPLVVVAGASATVASNYVGANGSWQGWKKTAGPTGVTSILDISVTIDKGGVPQLFIIGNDFKLYASHVSSSSTGGVTWTFWTSIKVGKDVRRISAIRHGDGRQQIFVVTTTGDMRSVWQKATTGWSKPSTMSASPVPGLVDVSAGWTADGHVQLFAIDTNGGGWTKSCNGASPDSTWSGWSSWSVPLHAPSAASPPKLDRIISISASRWREAGSHITPVVFVTDDQGNMYLTTYEAGSWRAWRSFYN